MDTVDFPLVSWSSHEPRRMAGKEGVGGGGGGGVGGNIRAEGTADKQLVQ